ncbi:hypothetical protein CPB84DRAFT_1855828 [Gymnopilus junonius]|uniref:Uncharacterized protein n=1 Tax=Gymnopilus junonius TaxID=109634 RepID=A0A9P5TG12_GYMJU|nr:hypothetical protein CPB84DRAFT_1855828 [Gymnopilus junonius]
MSDSDSSLTYHQARVCAQLSFRSPPKASGTKKKAVAKGALQTKNKEFPFTFESGEDNYLAFLSTILTKHGHDKLTPVVRKTRYVVKYILGGKVKKDAIDVDTMEEYEEMVMKILDTTPEKVTVFVNLEDIQNAQKKRTGHTDSSSNEGDLEDEGDVDGLRPIDRDLGRIRGLLEKKYRNPNDDGYTFIANDGERVPLTPGMISEWARCIYDGNSTIHVMPNTTPFDPKTCARSLFQTPKVAPASDLQSIASIFHDARALFTGDTTCPPNPPVTPSNPRPPSNEAATSSPPKLTPSRLKAFLEYAQENLGVQYATHHEHALSSKQYGPDILHLVSDQDLLTLEIPHGDAIRLKRAAQDWWNGPLAKRPCAAPARPRTPSPDPIRFIKRFHGEDGQHSVFGKGLVEGDNRHCNEYDWYYYNRVEKREVKVPDGRIPDLFEEYLSDPDIPFEPPTPEPRHIEAVNNEELDVSQ